MPLPPPRCPPLQTALTTEEAKEALRLQFAEKAAAFKALCDDRSSQIADLDGALEAQIGMVQELQKEYDSFVALLEEAQGLSDQMEQLGVIGNPHTPETILSLRAVYDALYKVQTLRGRCCCHSPCTAIAPTSVCLVSNTFPCLSCGCGRQCNAL